MADAPEKLLPLNVLCDKLSDARSIATTIELALATIDRDCTPNDAEDVRQVALMLTQQLREIEQQVSAHNNLRRQEAGHD